MKYLYPCKPNPLSLESKFFEELDRDTGWIAEIKKNGWRCLVYCDTGLTLWTRHNTIISEPLDAIRDSLRAVPDKTVLDGELVHFRTETKGVLYLFDILIYKGKLLVDLTLSERRKFLEEVHSRLTGIEIAIQVRVGKKELYRQAITAGDEGVVLKKLSSKYLCSDKRCLQNPFWLKVKKIENHIKVGG